MAHNVPFLSGRARYNILGTNPCWVYHKTASGSSLDGTAPATAAEPDPNKVDPEVSAGLAKFSELTNGGLFTLLGNFKKAVRVENVDASGITSVKTVHIDDPGVDVMDITTLVNASPFIPFTLPPGTVVKAIGGVDSYLGLQVKMAETRIL